MFFRRKKYRYFYPVPTNGVTGIKTQNPTGGYGVLYVAEDAPWVRIPFRRATDCQGKGCQFFQRNHTDSPCQNNKQRAIPMNETLTEMLERYCIAMGIKAEPESYLFPSPVKEGAAASKGIFDLRFRNLLMETGLYVPGKAHSRGQCLHCFRHYLLSTRLRKRKRTDALRTTLFRSCLSILDIMTWTKQRNT